MGEERGRPSAAVMTSAFIDAAELMGRVLGADGYPFVVIEHPMASATADQLRERGRLAADRCVELLTTGPAS
jgi:hypothetical protein